MKKLPSELELKLKNLPASPGVYLFKNIKGKFIYIGKAKNLRNRVKTYFQSSHNHSLRIFHMVKQVVDLELLLTDTEMEALILEANLIHEHKPRYNVALKDDKHFPYVKVTTQEPFPRILIVRRVDKDGATYFGPYTNARGMRKTVSFLTHLFKIRTCNFIIPPAKGKKLQVCLDYHIKRCGGPCENLQSEEDYKEGIDAVLMVLSGRSKKLIDQLTDKMKLASDNMDYEEAAESRDRIKALQSVIFKQKVDVGELIDQDIIALARDGNYAVAIVMQIREGVLIGRQDFQLSADAEIKDDIVLQNFLVQYYNNQPNLPEELYLPYTFPDILLFENWLKKQKRKKIRIITPQIGQKVRLVELAFRNARLLIDELLIQKQKQSKRTSKMVIAMKEALHLKKSPHTMVCFDISNTGETDSVGSCVFFENGQPKKKEYRHFKIKTVTGQDDFKMMQEIVARYFQRRINEELELPDLIVVDGGKGQLSSTVAELKKLNLDDLPVIGLAKRLEEVFIPSISDPIVIKKTSPALILLKRIRDEAHRFAITFNRKVRTKRTIKSALDDIKGIGPAKRQLLLKTFGSVERIKQAKPEELSSIKGITPELADLILKLLS